MSVVETRWFRNERWADTLWMLHIAKIETIAVASWTVTVWLATCRVGIKVYIDNVLISGGVVAIVEIPANTIAVLSETWTPPEVSIDGKYVKVELIVWEGTAYEGVLRTFRTEVFTEKKLDPIEWTVYYDLAYSAVIFPAPRSGIDFRYDGYYQSRIENFGYSPIVIIKRIQMDGLVMFLT